MNGILIFICFLGYVICSGIVFATSLILSHRERKDLYDRLMSGSSDAYRRLSDAGSAAGALSSRPVSAHKKAVDAFHRSGVEVDRK